MSNPDDIYFHDEQIHNTKAAEVIIPIVMELVKPSSILDIGCGIGTWLKVCKNLGIKNYFGIESHFVDSSKMLISLDKYLLHDLNTPIFLDKQFDLVISLEVAEHLGEDAAETFVETLIKHSKIILFSAAIPLQGGQFHLNEQWPIYWQKKFKKFGYEYYDIIRPLIWDNEKVDIWYRQNIFLVVHNTIQLDYPIYQNKNIIHPGFWMYKFNKLEKETKNYEIQIKHLNDLVYCLRGKLNTWENGKMGIRNYWAQLKNAIYNKIKLNNFFK